MQDRVLNLLKLCMQAKEKGHDVFFDYSPHVQKVEIIVYKNGWDKNNLADFKDYFYTDATESWHLIKIDMIENYIKELMSDVHTG